MSIEIKFTELGNHKILQVKGEITLANLEEMSDILWRAILDSPTSLIVDLGEVDYIDSSGIGLLVTCDRNMRDKKGKLALVKVRSDLMKVFRISDLDNFFTIYEKKEDIPL